MSKRQDINRAVLSGAPGAETPAQQLEPRAPVSHVGKMGQAMVGGLARENERLKDELTTLREEREHGTLILELDPKEIAHSRFVNRHALSLSLEDPDFKVLLDSLRRNEQDQAILVRPSPPGAPHGKPYEVAFGHRRHTAALLIDQEKQPEGWKIKARVKTLSDLELVEVMDRENAERKGISPYETGCHFLKCIQEGLYKSNADLAEKKQLTRQTISKYIQIAELPEPVLRAFKDPRTIKIAWIQPLQQALSTHRDALLAKATGLAEDKGTLEPESVLKALLKPPATERSRQLAQNANTGERVFRLKGSSRVGLRIIPKNGSLRLKWGRGVDASYQQQFALLLQEFAEKHLWENPPPLSTSAEEPSGQKT